MPMIFIHSKEQKSTQLNISTLMFINTKSRKINPRGSDIQFLLDIYKSQYNSMEGARDVMVVVAGIGHVDTSSNPGLTAFHIAVIPLGKV